MGIKIYQNLRILSIIKSELARDLVLPCLHHFHMVVISTITFYYFILQFLQGGKIDFVIGAFSIIVLLLAGMIEFFAIFYTAKISSLSIEFKRMAFTFYGHDKLKRLTIQGLQSISINLEFLSSVETMENGVRLDYFLRYLERVGYHTVTLLLTGK